MKILNVVRKKLNGLIKNTYWYNEVVFKGCKKFWNFRQFNLDVINLGSGASYYAFDYTGLKVKAANMALTSQYLLADYEILKNYSSHLKSGGTVLLGCCLFSLDGYDVTYFDDRYYTFLYPSSILHFSMQRLKKIRKIKDDPVMFFPLMSFFEEIKLRICRHKDSMSTSEIEKNAEHWMRNWAKEFSIDDFEVPMSIRNTDLKNQAVDILKQIKSFCDEKHFRLVVVLPPVSTCLRKHLSTNIRREYVEAYSNEPTLSGIEFKNYIDDTAFDDIHLFKNAYFLNRKGAQLFTKRVLQDLKLI